VRSNNVEGTKNTVELKDSNGLGEDQVFTGFLRNINFSNVRNDTFNIYQKERTNKIDN